MKIRIDRSSASSVHQQLKGAIENNIALGDMVAGDKLPSVRELALEVGVAPVTVSKVYSDLKAEGLIEARSGSGTYVADSAITRLAGRSEMPLLRREIDAVMSLALDAGCTPAHFMALINARMVDYFASRSRKRIVMIGLFDDATASYARCVEKRTGHLASVEPATLERLKSDSIVRERICAADLVLTFANLEEEIRQLLPDAKVLSLRFIPSETTRMALASIDPMARVGLVSRFADFQPILNLGVRRFAAHLRSVTTHKLDDPALPSALAECSVLILSTGADEAAQYAPPAATKIEYRHVPDPGDIDARVIPLLTQTATLKSSDRKVAS